MKELKEVEKLIIDLGLSMREAKTYTTLFYKKDFTASEIQQLVNIPRTKIYEVLHQLINKGFCVEKKIGRYKKYEVLEPESVFEKLLEKYKENLAIKENIANRVLSILLPIYEQREGKVDSLEYIEVVKDKKQIRERFFTLQKNAKKEILIFNKPPYVVLNPENRNIELDVLSKNIKCRSIYEYNDISNKEEIKIISFLISKGEDARLVNELPMKLVIFDEKLTMLSLNDPLALKPSITTIIINHPSFAKAQKYVFESIWKEAIPFEEFKIKEKIS